MMLEVDAEVHTLYINKRKMNDSLENQIFVFFGYQIYCSIAKTSEIF